MLWTAIFLQNIVQKIWIIDIKYCKQVMNSYEVLSTAKRAQITESISMMSRFGSDTFIVCSATW